MRKPEQKVWDTMRQRAPVKVWLERVENVVADGMPDVHVLMEGKMAWVELKHAVLPKRETTRVLGNKGLRQSQINWHLKAAAKSLPVYTVIRDDKGALYMIHASYAETINDMTRAELNDASIGCEWPGIFKMLQEGLFKVPQE